MTGTLIHVLIYACVPVIAALVGGLVSAFRPPKPAIRSAIQHCAAGVVFAVAAVELMPEILRQHQPVPVVAGFAAGVGAMLVLRTITRKVERSPSERHVPVPFLAAMGTDLLIDGFLIGLGFTAGAKEGKLLTLALSVELLALGLATAVTLTNAGLSRARTVAITGALALLVPGGALAGVLLLRGISGTGLEIVLSFGLAALLFLVTEELLVEAHEVPETPLITTAFFAGFLLFVVLGIIA